MALARNWDRLSDSQRQRYVGAGRRGRTGESLDPSEVRRYYESGGDLRTLRGHAPKPPSWAAPKDATLKEATGIADDKDVAVLKKWRKSKAAPKWIPSSTPTDVAAILSQISAPPPRWRSVTVSPIRGTGRYVMVVEVRGSPNKQSVILPDWNASSEVGLLLNDTSRMAQAKTKAEKKRIKKEWSTPSGRRLHISVTVTGTDPKAKNPPPPPIRPVKNTALPTRATKRKKA